MHPYVTDSRNSSRIVFFLFMLSVGVAWTYVWFSNKFGWSLPWWLEAPSILTVFGLLYWLFDTRLWRNKWIRPLIAVPDLNGSWSGNLTSSGNGHTTATSVQVTIQQSWTEILICLETTTSVSHSFSASLFSKRENVPFLCYQYLNRPKNSAPESFRGHPGTVDLRLENENLLKGDYYSGRGRQTYGCIELRRATTDKSFDLTNRQRSK